MEKVGVQSTEAVIFETGQLPLTAYIKSYTTNHTVPKCMALNNI